MELQVVEPEDDDLSEDEGRIAFPRLMKLLRQLRAAGESGDGQGRWMKDSLAV